MKEIAAAHDISHALRGVVDDDGKVIAGRRLLARQDNVAPGRRIDGDLTLLGFGPVQPTRACDRRSHVEAQRVRLARFDTARSLGGRRRFTIARVEWRAVWISQPRFSGGDQRRYFGPTLETRID